MYQTPSLLKRCAYPTAAHADIPKYPALDKTKTRTEQAEIFIEEFNTYRQQHAHVENIAPLLNAILRDAKYDEIKQDRAYRNDRNPLQTTHRINL